MIHRLFDWSAFNFALDQLVSAPERVARKTITGEQAKALRLDFALLFNGLTLLCRDLERYCNDTEDHGLSPCQHHAAVSILRLLDQGRTKQHAERNKAIRDRLSELDRFVTGIVADTRIALAGRHSISQERVRKIASNPTPLEQFIEGKASKDAANAALAALSRIRRQILADTGKGEAARAPVCTGYSAVIEPRIQSKVASGRWLAAECEEWMSEIDQLVADGQEPLDAMKSVSKRAGVNLSRVKTAYNRRAAKADDDLLAYLSAHNNEVRRAIDDDSDGSRAKGSEFLTLAELKTALNRTN